MKKKTDIKKLSVAAVLCAVAYLCMFLFRFKVSFLTFDFKDAVLCVIAFLYGPFYALMSSLTVALLELVTVSDTGLYGFLMNFISSAAFSCVSALIYKYRRTLQGAVLGALSGVLVMTACMLIANIFITPFYMRVPREAVIDMIPSLLLPFNLVKGAFNAAVTMIIYKPTVSVFKKVRLIPQGDTVSAKKGKFLLICSVSLAVIAASLVLLFIVLNGEFFLFSK